MGFTILASKSSGFSDSNFSISLYNISSSTSMDRSFLLGFNPKSSNFSSNVLIEFFSSYSRDNSSRKDLPLADSA